MSENEKEVSTSDKKSFEYKLGYRIGSICAYVVAACITSIAVALTIKFIQWILW